MKKVREIILRSFSFWLNIFRAEAVIINRTGTDPETRASPLSAPGISRRANAQPSPFNAAT